MWKQWISVPNQVSWQSIQLFSRPSKNHLDEVFYFIYIYINIFNLQPVYVADAENSPFYYYLLQSQTTLKPLTLEVC